MVNAHRSGADMRHPTNAGQDSQGLMGKSLIVAAGIARQLTLLEF
jgi:hypothetical protein